MKRALVLGPVLAAVVLVFAGCPLPGGGVTITGTVSGEYFDITSDVTVTITEGAFSATVQVPVVSVGYSSSQLAAFSVTDVPFGDYTVTATFEEGSSSSGGTLFSSDGTSWVSVDNEVVTGSSSPYTRTITIDSLPVQAEKTLYIYLGNVG